MKSRREALRAHYIGLLKRAATWAGLASLVATMFVPMGASATSQLTLRKATLSTSAAGSASNVVFSFTTSAAAGSYLAKGMKFQLCNSPLSSVGCTAPTGADFSTASATLGTTTGISGWAESNKTATEYDITKSGGDTLNSTAVTVAINGLTLPTSPNQEFYFRVTTYTDTGLSAPAGGQEFGGIAESTTQQLSVTANVQEDLTFCVGTSGTDCTNVTGSTVTLSPNPMTTSGASKGTAVMSAATNGSSGYSIVYNGTSFTDTTSDTITAFPSTGGTSTPGSEQFGFNLKSNTTPSVGANPSGGSGSASTNYNTSDTFSYSTAGGVQVASAAGPTLGTLYTMAYVANVAATTKPGAYTATQTYIATATF